MNFWLFADSICGKYRPDNEDFYRCFYLEERKTYVLCLADGMGGEQGGEIAGNLAVDSVQDYLTKNLPKNPDFRADRACLINAFNQANMQVFQKALTEESLHNMGSTLLTALVGDDGETLIANIGDSRAYCWHKNQLQQLTVDHNYAQKLLDSGKITYKEYLTHPGRNMLTKAVGTANYINPDIFSLYLQSNDKLLLCSDGIHGYLSKYQMEMCFLQGKTAEICTKRLLSEAEELSRDNATAICLSVG